LSSRPGGNAKARGEIMNAKPAMSLPNRRNMEFDISKREF
jgi:hypothetical protein